MKMFTSNPFLVPTLLVASLLLSGFTRAQDAKSAQAQKANVSPIEAINAKYRLEVEKLERERLKQLSDLAAGQPKAESEATYSEFFQLAIAKGLYADAEQTAGRVLKGGEISSNIDTLATLVKIVGEAERGAFEDSLKSLTAAVSARNEKLANANAGVAGDQPLPIPGLVAIVEAYYQRLIRGSQYAIALKAMNIVAANAVNPAVKELASRRVKQLELVGRPAPSIVGVDLDGKRFSLEDVKGDVVLVVYWATWCLPIAQEIPWLEEVYEAHKKEGFRIVGIDVDAAQDDAADPQSLIANVRRYVVEYNIQWPILMSGQGEKDLTRAYSISDIPANVLIGRDGKVIHLDVTGSKLEKVVAEATAQKR